MRETSTIGGTVVSRQPPQVNAGPIVVQTCVPDYRLAFFELLFHYCQGLCVYGGSSYYQESIRTAASNEQWYRAIRNRFFFSRKVLWQHLPLSLFFTDRPVIVELNPRSMSTWLLSIVRSLQRKPTIFWGHAWSRSGRTSITNSLRLIMWFLGDARLVYTKRQVEELSMYIRDNIYPVRNALYSEAAVEPQSKQDRNSFIYVGRLTAEKKPALLISAFSLFWTRNNDARLKIVGSGPEWPKLHEMVKELGLSDAISFEGHIAEINVLSSLYSESIAAVSPGYVGLSATQAFFFGVPMLIANNETHSPEIEACRDGFNATFFKSNDRIDLANLMEKVWGESEIWRSQAKNIRYDVVKNYSIEKMAFAFVLATQGVSEKLQVGSII